MVQVLCNFVVIAGIHLGALVWRDISDEDEENGFSFGVCFHGVGLCRCTIECPVLSDLAMFPV